MAALPKNFLAVLLIAPLIGGGVIYLLKLSLINFGYFWVSYFWNFALLRSAMEKSERPRPKMSFMNVIITLNQGLRKILLIKEDQNKWVDLFSRIFIPSVFVGFLSIFNVEGQWFWGIIGAGLFELIIAILKIQFPNQA